jgi:hypothetical protein
MVYVVGNYDDLDLDSIDSGSDSDLDSGSVDSGFYQLKESTLTDIDNRIAYVYIRAHSALPVISDRKGKFKDIDIYEIPNDINVVKLTAASNGERNNNLYEYQDKKQLIMDGIKEYEEEYEEETLESPWKVAKKIEKKLKKFEKYKEIPNAELRNVVSNDKIVLNKIIHPLPQEELGRRRIKNYMPVQILFYNKDFDDFDSADIYEVIHRIYRVKQNRLIPGYADAITIEDIIEYLRDILKVKNVVLLDFTCSSFSENTSDRIDKEKLINYLNDWNWHGGKRKKTKKNKKNKKTKKTKKTKKNNKVRKTKKN